MSPRGAMSAGPLRYLALMWAFLRRDAKIAFSYRLQFVFQVASVMSVCITFFFLSIMLRRVEGGIESLDRYGGRYYGFVLVGLAFSSYLDSALRMLAQAIRQAQMTGTLEAMLATRTPVGAVVAGSALYTLVFSTFRMALFLAFGSLLLERQSLQWAAWPGALAVLALTVAATGALGIFAAGFIVWFKQGDPITGAIAGLSWLLSGILYPKEIFPQWVQGMAEALPMTHTLRAMRLALLTGAPPSEFADSLVFLGVFALVGVPLALIWFRFAVGRARRAGSLAKY